MRAALGACGLALMAYAVYGAVSDPDLSLVGVASFLAAVLLGHDLIVLPVAIAVGVLVGRYVPPAVRPPVQAGLFASAVVGFIAIPLLVGAGRISDNPTRLPLNYGRGLLLVWGAIWLGVGAAIAWRQWRAHRDRGARP